MTLPLDEAALAVVQDHRALALAEDAWRQRTYGDRDEYTASRNGYTAARTKLSHSVQALKESLSGDGVRRAAEARSPMASALAPNKKDIRLPGEDHHDITS